MTVATRKLWILPVAVLGVCLMPVTSRADIVISLGNGSPTNTLQYRAQSNATTAILEDTAIKADVMTVTTDTASTGNPGQANVVPVNVNFTTATFAPISPYLGFTAVEIDPRFVNDGTFTVTGVDQFFTAFSKTFTIDNNNRFTLDALGMQFITSVTLTGSTANIGDITQVRIGDLVLRNAAVPEPSTVISTLIVVGLGGIVGWRRRRPAQVASN